MATFPTKEEKGKKAVEILEELQKLLDERIEDLHKIKGMMQSRHAYCYYRKYVWDALHLLKQRNYRIGESKISQDIKDNLTE